MRRMFAGMALVLALSLTALPVLAKEQAFTEAAAIGKKALGDFDLLVRNGSGKDLEKLQLQVDGEGFSPNLLEKEVFADGEERHLYIKPEIAKEKGKDPVYDLLLTFADGSAWTFAEVPVQKAEEALLKEEADGIFALCFSGESLKKDVLIHGEEKKQEKKQESAPAASYGEATYGEATYGEATYGEATYGEATYGEATYGEAAGGETQQAEEPENSGYDVGYGPSLEEDHCLDDGTMLN